MLIKSTPQRYTARPRAESLGRGARRSFSMHDVIVVGAGVAGLQCARRLQRAGADVLVLDRADKVGGRCATRRHGGEPFDYGPQFLHGFDAGFLAALAAVPAQRIEGWPRRIEGTGTPCQPDAFAPDQDRLAFTEGLHEFPRSLAEGLAVTLCCQVTAVSAAGGVVSARGAAGEEFQGRDLVLALALEQSIPFLRMLPEAGGLDGALALLGMFASSPCLAVAAGYPASVPAPAWDILYPEDEPAVLLVGHDSAKRPAARSPVLVCQGSARWSRARFDAPKEEWPRELLGMVARRVGSWAAQPAWVHAHRWRHSRLDRANELAAPLELRVQGSRIGVAGDLFAAGGGVQAAWLSGDRLGALLGGSASGKG
jgi:renalase